MTKRLLGSIVLKPIDAARIGSIITLKAVSPDAPDVFEFRLCRDGANMTLNLHDERGDLIERFPLGPIS